jgi:hypothetical protein
MWLWTCLQDIAANKSIREALVYEENFFRSRPVSDPFLPYIYPLVSIFYCKADATDLLKLAFAVVLVFLSIRKC